MADGSMSGRFNAPLFYELAHASGYCKGSSRCPFDGGRRSAQDYVFGYILKYLPR